MGQITRPVSLKAKDVEMESDPVTKRTILSLVAKIWDPLGMLSPVSLAFRIDLQDLWRRGVSWDEPLDDDDKQRWNNTRDSDARVIEVSSASLCEAKR